MDRSDFQKLTNLRVKEAKALLDSQCFEGAYYMLGYAVECALKACIARQINRYEFPDKDFATKVYTHKLSELLKHAGLQARYDAEAKVNLNFAANWAIVKDWNETYRYVHSINPSLASDFYSAVTARRNGVLPWLKKQW